MSLPSYTIKCSECNFSDSYLDGTHYVYEGPPAHEPEVQVAWCRACDKVVNICAPLTVMEAQVKIRELYRLIGGCRGGLFARFLKRRKQVAEKASQDIQIVRKRLKYFRSSPHKNRCLVCGSHDVFPFELPYDSAYDVIEALNVEHSCGGQLLIEEGPSFAYSEIPKVFDENGVIVLDGESKGTPALLTIKF